MPLNIGGGESCRNFFFAKIHLFAIILADAFDVGSPFFFSRGLETTSPLKRRHRQFNTHTGSYDGVHRTKWRARWQIIGMLILGGGIVGVLVYLSLAG